MGIDTFSGMATLSELFLLPFENVMFHTIQAVRSDDFKGAGHTW